MKKTPASSGLRFGQWAAREAQRCGIRAASVMQRVRAGFYIGLKLKVVNPRVIFVVKEGTLRQRITQKAAAALRSNPRATTTRPVKKTHLSNNSAALVKYTEWMSCDDCGGRRTPLMGNH